MPFWWMHRSPNRCSQIDASITKSMHSAMLPDRCIDHRNDGPDHQIAHPSWACHRLLPFVYQPTPLCQYWHRYAFEQHTCQTLVPPIYHVHNQNTTNIVSPSSWSTMTWPSVTQPKMWHLYNHSAPLADGQDFIFRRWSTASHSKYDGPWSYHSGFAITRSVWEHFFCKFLKKCWMTMTVPLFGQQKLAFLYCDYVIANPYDFFKKR